ncbi:hypothetical protein FM106_21180 [Brachybacterium faecium]|nr:hypothetical protein FM106_21180 [Brachybacterium faecium]
MTFLNSITLFDIKYIRPYNCRTAICKSAIFYSFMWNYLKPIYFKTSDNYEYVLK